MIAKPVNSQEGDESFGIGWGGPPSGDKGPSPFVKGHKGIPKNMDTWEERQRLKAQMLGVMQHVALYGKNENARVVAADKLLDRVEGKPVQRTMIDAHVTNKQAEDEQVKKVIQSMPLDLAKRFIEQFEGAGAKLPGDMPQIIEGEAEEE